MNALPLVGIGGSLGNLQPLKEFFTDLALDTGLAYVVLLHAEPLQDLRPAEVISQWTSLKVVELRASAPPAQPLPNHVYTLSGQDGVILNSQGMLQPVEFRTDKQTRFPIDDLFFSIANREEGRAIGILLAGAAEDGREGAKRIKEVGGILLVQDGGALTPSAWPTMVSRTYGKTVDFVLWPAEIAKEVGRLAKSLAAEIEEETQVENEAPSVQTEIIGLVRKASGVDFTHYKSSTLVRRTKRRMALKRLNSLEAYLAHLRQNPLELENLYQDFLINVTRFFRDSEIFETLAKDILPRIIEQRGPEEPIRVWVPGCSTGEEVYSLAILLLETLGEHAAHVPLQLFGTDISEACLEKARMGLYSERLKTELSAARLEKFFIRRDKGYQISKHIREACVFAKHNVIGDPPLSKMDLISCRNLLIYFGPVLQQKVIPLLHFALKPGKILLLGKSEIIDLFGELFSCVDKPNKIYAKKTSASRVPMELLAGVRIPIKPDLSKRAQGMATVRDVETDLRMEIDRLVVANFSPAGIVINENLDILQFRGETAPFLMPNSGRASLHLAKMAHPDLLHELRAAIEEAQSGEGFSVRRRHVAVRNNHKIRFVNFLILPVKGPLLQERYLFITFEEDQSIPGSGEEPVEGISSAGAPLEAKTEDPKRSRLYEELRSTRLYLQTIIDEREMANEELQSANEEVISSNEELQTINQELETSKEELQSSNEELTTINEELQERMEELRRSEERFRILVSGVRDYAIFILDLQGNIQSWNIGAERIKGYKAEEIIGKNFSIFYPEEDRLRGKPAAELVQAREEGQCQDQGWRIRKDRSVFWAHVLITALYDANGEPYGFAKVTRDITETRKADQQIRELNESLERKVRERTEVLEQQTHELARSNAELERFAYISSHDMKEPLRMIANYSELLEKHCRNQLDAEGLKYLKYITGGAKKMYQLIADILTYSRIGKTEIQHEVLSTEEMVQEVLHNLHSAIQETQAKITSDELPSIQGNKVELIQLFQNLIDNALKFRKGIPHIHIGCVPKLGEWIFRVQDNGLGIDPQFHEKIFVIFQRLHTQEQYPGTGIGLAICKRIVEKNKGRIWVESKPNAGATFYFSWPK